MISPSLESFTSKYFNIYLCVVGVEQVFQLNMSKRYNNAYPSIFDLPVYLSELSQLPEKSYISMNSFGNNYLSKSGSTSLTFD